MTDVAKTRRCGDCNVCCTLMAVEPLEKPAFTRCSHVCSRGCRVYKDRPEVCRTWHCAWVLGHLPHAWRPDKIGLMGDIQTGHRWVFKSVKTEAVFDTPAISQYLKGLSQKGAEIVAGSSRGITHLFKMGFCRKLTEEQIAALNAGDSMEILVNPK